MKQKRKNPSHLLLLVCMFEWQVAAVESALCVSGSVAEKATKSLSKALRHTTSFTSQVI